MRRLQAVIFDVDGVLVDSYQAHFESWRRMAREEGVDFTESDFARTFGRTSRDIVRAVWSGTLAGEDVERLDARKEALYREIVSASFPAMDGARELVAALAAEEVALAVASSGPPENVALALDRLGGTERFRAIVTGRDVTRGKPDPQPFRLAGERLGSDPARTVVVEDAPDGIVAAHRAGMAAIALLSTGRREEDFVAARPELVVRSLRELDPGRVAAVLR